MTSHKTPVYHLFRCPHCEGTHFEHERTATMFARFAAKHLSKCGNPQEPRYVDEQTALTRIITREVDALHVPEDWVPPAVRRARSTA